MDKILIVEGLCRWNGYIKKMLSEEGHFVLSTRTLLTLTSLLDNFKPTLVLIGLGVRPDESWGLFRQLKANDTDLPVLIFHAVNADDVEKLKSAVEQALHESKVRNCRQSSSTDHDDILTDMFPVAESENDSWPWQYGNFTNHSDYISAATT